MTKSQRFRELIDRGKIFVRPSCFDAMSAKILEANGFEAVGLSGYAVSVSRFGKPDSGQVTLTESVQMARYICRSVDIPVMVDADTGYGNAINVMRTVEEMIGAGAAALFIEDQVEPKRCGHVSGKQIIPVEEAVGKYRAADRVRRELDTDFVLMARTDARGAVGGGFEEALNRAKAYVDAGVDLVFPEGLLSAEEIHRFTEELAVPISYNRTGVSPMLSLGELDRLGVRMVANASGMVRSSMKALWDAYADMTADAGQAHAEVDGILESLIGDDQSLSTI